MLQNKAKVTPESAVNINVSALNDRKALGSRSFVNKSGRPDLLNTMASHVRNDEDELLASSYEYGSRYLRLLTAPSIIKYTAGTKSLRIIFWT